MDVRSESGGCPFGVTLLMADGAREAFPLLPPGAGVRLTVQLVEAAWLASANARVLTEGFSVEAAGHVVRCRLEPCDGFLFLWVTSLQPASPPGGAVGWV
jgi:hypothetical protein